MISTSYITGKSILHKADPRIKFILLLFTVTLFFLPLSIMEITIFFTIIATATIISLGFSKLIQAMKMILPILIFVVFLTPPFFMDGDTILKIKETVILTTVGISQTFRLIIRFAGITVSFYLFFSCTSINYFILTLEWFKLPYRAALVVTIALRYIPSMVIIYNNIKDAHRLRGNYGSRRRLFKKFNSMFPTLVSVLIQSVKSIPSLSMALELKGIGLETKRSQYSFIISSNLILQFIWTGVIVLLILTIVVFI